MQEEAEPINNRCDLEPTLKGTKYFNFMPKARCTRLLAARAAYPSKPQASSHTKFIMQIANEIIKSLKYNIMMFYSFNCWMF